MQRQLSPAGQQALDDVARRHGFGSDAVAAMLDALVHGGGAMAQFSHPEFGGPGQWMRGGMTMVGDMFNHGLKARVDALCTELAALLAQHGGALHGGSASFQSQSQSQSSSSVPGGAGGAWQQQGSGDDGAAPAGGGSSSSSSSLFVPQGDWWGPELRWPDATGAQNGARYAWFSQARRLAVEAGGHVTVYDTLDHRIGGVSQQQQSGGGSLSFTSQHGTVDVAALPVVSVDGRPAAASSSPPSVAPPAAPAAHAFAPPMPSSPPAAPAGPQGLDVFAAIERLAELHGRGVLTAEEFAAKKAELLARL